MELIDREGLKNFFKITKESCCKNCTMKTCNCDLYCRLPSFLEDDVNRIIDEQMVVNQKEDGDWTRKWEEL